MYDLEEIKKDIFKVEGIPVNMDGFVETKKFVTRYSDHFPEQGNGDGGKESIEKRVDMYLEFDENIKDELLQTLLLEKKNIAAKEKRRAFFSHPLVVNISTVVMVGVIFWLFKTFY